MSLLGAIISTFGKSNVQDGSSPSIVRDVISNPDDFKLEAEVVDGEIVVKIARKNERRNKQ